MPQLSLRLNSTWVTKFYVYVIRKEIKKAGELPPVKAKASMPPPYMGSVRKSGSGAITMCLHYLDPDLSLTAIAALFRAYQHQDLHKFPLKPPSIRAYSYTGLYDMSPL